MLQELITKKKKHGFFFKKIQGDATEEGQIYIALNTI